MTLTLEVELPADLARFRLPEAVAARLQALLDRQDSGQPLTPQEREEAEGLVTGSRGAAQRPHGSRYPALSEARPQSRLMWRRPRARSAR